MAKQELYLKTIFCCMACDGDIAKEEIEMVKILCEKDDFFKNIESETYINNWIGEINERGAAFLQTFLSEINSVQLDKEEQLKLIELAFKTIEADNRIEYSEVKFFKKIRSRLSVSDEDVLEKFPEKEDYLLPDINASETLEWDNNIQFSKLEFDKIAK